MQTNETNKLVVKTVVTCIFYHSCNPFNSILSFIWLLPTIQYLSPPSAAFFEKSGEYHTLDKAEGPRPRRQAFISESARVGTRKRTGKEEEERVVAFLMLD